jgi:hypothetical protein
MSETEAALRALNTRLPESKQLSVHVRRPQQ